MSLRSQEPKTLLLRSHELKSFENSNYDPIICLQEFANEFAKLKNTNAVFEKLSIFKVLHTEFMESANRNIEFIENENLKKLIKKALANVGSENPRVGDFFQCLTSLDKKTYSRSDLKILDNLKGLIRSHQQNFIAMQSFVYHWDKVYVNYSGLFDFSTTTWSPKAPVTIQKALKPAKAISQETFIKPVFIKPVKGVAHENSAVVEVGLNVNSRKSSMFSRFLTSIANKFSGAINHLKRKKNVVKGRESNSETTAGPKVVDSAQQNFAVVGNSPVHSPRIHSTDMVISSEIGGEFGHKDERKEQSLEKKYETLQLTGERMPEEEISRLRKKLEFKNAIKLFKLGKSERDEEKVRQQAILSSLNDLRKRAQERREQAKIGKERTVPLDKDSITTQAQGSNPKTASHTAIDLAYEQLTRQMKEHGQKK